MLIVRRSKPTSNFLIIPNATVRDDRLSYCARGLLIELLSRPPGWETNADALSARARRYRDVVGEGRRAMRAAFAELEDAGYMIRRVENRTGGDKKGGQYISVLEVYDVPQPRSDGHTGNGTTVNGTRVNGTSVTGTSSVSTDGRSTEEEDAGEEHSSALAAARAGHEAARKDRLRADLQGWYDAADKLNDERLRRHLLAFERKRPQIYRECRQSALSQIGGQAGGKLLLGGPEGVRMTDMLSFKYALLHYIDRVPDWLVKLPR